MWIFLPNLFFTEEKQYNFSWEKYLSKRSLIKHTFSWHDNLLYNVHSTVKRLYIYVYSIQFHESKSALLIWITLSKLHLNKKRTVDKALQLYGKCMPNNKPQQPCWQQKFKINIIMRLQKERQLLFEGKLSQRKCDLWMQNFPYKNKCKMKVNVNWSNVIIITKELDIDIGKQTQYIGKQTKSKTGETIKLAWSVLKTVPEYANISRWCLYGYLLW